MKHLFILFLLILCACTREELTQVMPGLKSNEQKSREIKLAIQRQCEELGIPIGSPNYYNCYTHYESMVIQAMLSGSNNSRVIPPVTEFSSAPNIRGPFNPIIECDTKKTFNGETTTCY